jgi:hypothetical protein
MAADRVPQPGEVWVMRHLRALNRGRVTILPRGVGDDRVRYRYHGTGTEHTAESVAAFVLAYDFLATDEQSAIDAHGPQVVPGVRRLVDMPIGLGTAVK